jgi:predicted dinucleotide-binding enzyme
VGTNRSGDGQQVVFISSNYPDASTTIAALASKLGFASIRLGMLAEGGTPLHVRDGRLVAFFFKT